MIWQISVGILSIKFVVDKIFLTDLATLQTWQVSYFFLWYF